MVTDMLWVPDALTEAGVNVKVLDGWDGPAKAGYYWREDNDLPAGHMHHHTATESYTPNRDKANGYAGLGEWESDRLYQSGDALEPFYVVANAYPAPISSGDGNITVLEDYVRQDRFILECPGSDTEGWAGNTHYWNTEYILNGIGAPLDQRVWDMMVTVSAVIGRELGWTPYRNIAHGTHTWRKVDLWAGQYQDFVDTLEHMQAAVAAWEGTDMYALFVEGIVTGWAEDPVKTRDEFDRLEDAGLLGGSVDYWVDLLDNPTDPAWLGFYARTELSSWGR